MSGVWRDEAMVVKPDSIRDLGAVKTEIFGEIGRSFSEKFWQLENAKKENNFAVFHHTDHIILRFVHDHDDLNTTFAHPLWHAVAAQLEPELMRIVEPYQLKNPQISKAMFARLKPRAVIDRHVDAARGNYFSHKIHIPVHTDPQILFVIGEEYFHLAVGRAYEVNNIMPHGVVNPTDISRIHFIFEVFDAG